MKCPLARRANITSFLSQQNLSTTTRSADSPCPQCFEMTPARISMSYAIVFPQAGKVFPVDQSYQIHPD